LQAFTRAAERRTKDMNIEELAGKVVPVASVHKVG
jgi:hypothetical protein